MGLFDFLFKQKPITSSDIQVQKLVENEVPGLKMKVKDYKKGASLLMITLFSI